MRHSPFFLQRPTLQFQQNAMDVTFVGIQPHQVQCQRQNIHPQELQMKFSTSTGSFQINVWCLIKILFNYCIGDIEFVHLPLVKMVPLCHFIDNSVIRLWKVEKFCNDKLSIFSQWTENSCKGTANPVVSNSKHLLLSSDNLTAHNEDHWKGCWKICFSCQFEIVLTRFKYCWQWKVFKTKLFIVLDTCLVSKRLFKSSFSKQLTQISSGSWNWNWKKYVKILDLESMKFFYPSWLHFWQYERKAVFWWCFEYTPIITTQANRLVVCFFAFRRPQIKTLNANALAQKWPSSKTRK